MLTENEINTAQKGKRIKVKEGFNNRLEELVALSSKTQVEIASALEIGPAHLCNLLSGKANPSVVLIDRICAYFKCHKDWLVLGTESKVVYEDAGFNLLLSETRKIYDSLKDDMEKVDMHGELYGVLKKFRKQ